MVVVQIDRMPRTIAAGFMKAVTLASSDVEEDDSKPPCIGT